VSGPSASSLTGSRRVAATARARTPGSGRPAPARPDGFSPWPVWPSGWGCWRWPWQSRPDSHRRAPRRPQPADHGRRCQLVVSAFPADHTGPVELTTSGMVHFAAGMVAFVGLAVAPPLLTRHLVTPRRPRAALLRGLAVAAPVGLAVYAATTVLGETARRPVRPPVSPRAGRARHGRRVRGIAGHGGAQPHPGGPEPAHRGSRPSRLLAIAVGITGSGSRPARSHLNSHESRCLLEDLVPAHGLRLSFLSHLTKFSRVMT
jgi:hypothetical protein